jgi:hypothetical protein
MIYNVKKHAEKMKLSDKFPQPFVTGSVADMLANMNNKQKKSLGGKNRKRK